MKTYKKIDQKNWKAVREYVFIFSWKRENRGNVEKEGLSLFVEGGKLKIHTSLVFCQL